MNDSTRLIKLAVQTFEANKLVRLLLYVIGPAILFYGLALGLLKAAGYETMEILRDPAQQSGASSLLGFISNIGIWLWVSSTAICFFTILTSDDRLTAQRKELLFLAGTLSFLLAIDDFFLIHDRYINQNLCYLTYCVFALLLLWRHYETIFAIEGLAFLLAGSFLGLSIFTDLVQSHIPIHYSYVQIVEEGFKFLGGATWLYFNARVSSFRPAPAVDHQAPL
jgi:hypothetical protein